MGRTTHKVSRLGFIADQGAIARNNGRQIDWDAVPASYVNGTEHTITANGASAAGATTLTVQALPVDLPDGTVLDFGVHSVNGGQMLAKLNGPASAGDTSVTVDPLPEEVEDTSTATYVDGGTGDKVIPAGKIMAELASGKIIPRDSVTGAETATCLLATGATENNREDARSGYGCIVGGVIYENLLPDSGAANFATWQGELEAAGVGVGWVWETYADDRAS